MSQYYFISGLPRSGSTLLSNIINQNPDFYSDIASPINFIVEKTIDIITNCENNMILDEEKRKNIIYGIFDGYYRDNKKSIIFDSSRNWTKNTSLLKTIFPYTKIVCTVRDIVSILNSFEILFSKNPFHSITILENSDNVFSRCDDMMDKNNGIITLPWIFLKQGYYLNPEMIHFVEYKKLCKYPKETMKKIYEFLEKPYYSHNFDNLEYSNEEFDKACNLKYLHTIKKKVEYNPPKNILPTEIIEKYARLNMEFWKDGYNKEKNKEKMLYL